MVQQATLIQLTAGSKILWFETEIHCKNKSMKNIFARIRPLQAIVKS